MTDENVGYRSGYRGFLWIIVLLFFVYGALQLWKAYVRYDIGIKYDHAMKQCEKYGGIHGEVPVVTKGVYDHSRTVTENMIFDRAAIFINSGLHFVEFKSDVVALSFLEKFETNGPYYTSGREKFPYYRVYVTTTGDPYCRLYERLLSEGLSPFEAANLGENQCIAVVGFSDPSRLEAPYELVVTDKVVDEAVSIEWNNLEVIDRRTRQVAASFNTFSHCFTRMAKNPSEGFGYCRGIYGNPKVRPKCPADYAKDARVITTFGKSAFTFTGSK